MKKIRKYVYTLDVTCTIYEEPARATTTNTTSDTLNFSNRKRQIKIERMQVNRTHGTCCRIESLGNKMRSFARTMSVAGYEKRALISQYLHTGGSLND